MLCVCYYNNNNNKKKDLEKFQPLDVGVILKKIRQNELPEWWQKMIKSWKTNNKLKADPHTGAFLEEKKKKRTESYWEIKSDEDFKNSLDSWNIKIMGTLDTLI